MTSKILLLLICLLSWALSGNTKTFIRQKAFIQNIGQITDQYGYQRSEIDFKLQATPGLNVFLGNGAIHYQWSHCENRKRAKEPTYAESITMYRMDLSLIGANPDAYVTTENGPGATERFYTSQAAGKGATAASYTSVTYHNIYPGIDWHIYLNNDDRMEHDFIIHPNGKVSDIRIGYDGANRLCLSENGSMKAETDFGTITDAVPYAYEQSTGKKVLCQYILEGSELTYDAANYSGTLIIDPVVEWSTYFGGTDYDDISAVVHNNDGSFVVAGSTSSASNIATTGAFQFTFGGGNGLIGADAFIAKFSEDGACLWSSYYGGTGTDLGRGLAKDTAGNIYLSGRTNSLSGISTTSSHQPVKAGTPGGYDCFLVKFDTAGQRIWGTYYGGSGQDGSLQVTVACDQGNGVFLAGNTASADQIATSGSHQPNFGGSQDAFVAKFSTEGIFNWGSYMGAAGLDVFHAATCDTSGNILLAGYSSSPGLASVGAYQQTIGGAEDALLAKFNGQGQLQWATYLGGTDQDRALSIKAVNNAFFIGGITSSTTAISSAGAYQPSLGDVSGDGFLAGFNAAGQRLWGTYYGGPQNDAITGISEIEDNKFYITGTTMSASAIATLDGLDTSLTGIYNCIVSCFDTTGSIVWGSYFGTLSDEGSAISVSGDKIILAGTTTSSTGIGTAGAHQTMIGGDLDGFLVQINNCQLPAAIDTVIGNRNICSGDTLILQVLPPSAFGDYQWLVPAGWTAISTGDTLIAIAGNSSAAIKVYPINTCGAGDTMIVDITVAPSPMPVISRSGNILATTLPFSTYQWNRNGVAITGATSPTVIAAENGSYTVTVTNTGACDGTSLPLIVSDITALKNKDNEHALTIYPNPTTGIIHLNLESKTVLHVTDKLGRIIHRQNLSAGFQTMDVSELAAGVYMIMAYDSNGQMIGSYKLVKE